MKNVLVAILISAGLALPSVAQSVDPASLDWGGMGSFLVSMAQQSHAGLGWNLNGASEKTLYVPARTFHSADKSVNYAQIAVGAGLLPDKHGEPICGLLINGPAITAKMWSKWQWANLHSTGLKLPEIWMGPLVKAPLPGRSWTWRESVLGQLSIALPLGGGK